MAQLLDGKKTSAEIRNKIAEDVKELVENGGKTPHLVVIIVGNDPASETYVRNKIKACENVGFKSEDIKYDENVSEEELLQKIAALNNDKDVDGFIVQLPLPGHISSQKVTESISPEKDVDGFHPVNIGRMAKNLPCFVSATPFGILTLLEWYNIETSGKHCVILGRSEIVGSPMSMLMARKTYPGNCTVTLCHSRTRDLASHARQADILIAAMGKQGFVTGDMVKEGAVVIDVGTNRVEDATKKKGYALKGDVAFEEVEPKCSYITPVPGGVGPMTIAALLNNTLQAAKIKSFATK